MQPIRPITLPEIHAARARIAPTILRTPLIRIPLPQGAPDIRLKLENLQPTNAYKIRGALNAVALLPESERAKGVWTISSGNAGQGVAYAARAAGVPCTVVTFDTAPPSKLARMKALGATLIPVPFDTAIRAMSERSFPGLDAAFVHPFDSEDFMAGHATMGLEIFEDCPNVSAVIAGIGGGGLVVALGSALKALNPDIKVYGVEPETAAPHALSFERGEITDFANFTPSYIDGAGGKNVFPRMWERMKTTVDGSFVVTLEETRRAMRLMAETTRIIAEAAGALPLAAALSGRAGPGPVVAVVSGGNIDIAKFCELIESVK